MSLPSGIDWVEIRAKAPARAQWTPLTAQESEAEPYAIDAVFECRMANKECRMTKWFVLRPDRNNRMRRATPHPVG